MVYLSQKEIPFGKIMCMQNDIKIDWYQKSKFSVRYDYPLD